MSLRARVSVVFAALVMLVAPALVAPTPAQAALPAGTCGASQGCGCGGVYVLKFKYILFHC